MSSSPGTRPSPVLQMGEGCRDYILKSARSSPRIFPLGWEVRSPLRDQRWQSSGKGLALEDGCPGVALRALPSWVTWDGNLTAPSPWS